MTSPATINVELSPRVLAYLEAIANRNAQSLEEALQDELSLLAAYQLPLIEDLTHLADIDLIRLLDKPFNPLYRKEIDGLVSKQQVTTLKATEQVLLDKLLDYEADYVLIRSQVLVLLQDRGHDITDFLTYQDAE